MEIGWGAFNACIVSNKSINYRGSIEDWCSKSRLIIMPLLSNGYNLQFNSVEANSISLPIGMTALPDSSFIMYKNLVSITLPNTVTCIGKCSFFDCSNLMNITIPNSVSYIGENAFNGCASLTSITLPESITSIENYTFLRCTNITNITIPNTVISIGTWAFFECTSLTSITLPSSVSFIDSAVFQNCSSLKSITCLAATPPDAIYAFNGFNASSDFTIYVPAESVVEYKNANPWKYYNILPIQ